MNPVSVLKMLWHHKISMVSVLVLTLLAGSYVYFLAPRSYSASTVYVLVTPKVPTAAQLAKDPALAALNSDNPYLRSADSSLIAQVMVTKLSSSDTADSVVAAGLKPDYTVTLPATSGTGQLIRIEASGSSPANAIATVEALGDRLKSELRSVQKVNNADDLYLFTALQIDAPNKATEQFSSRLRALIVVVIGGVILLFGAVSIARLVENSRATRGESLPVEDRRSSRRRRVTQAARRDFGELPEPPESSSQERTPVQQGEAAVARDIEPDAGGHHREPDIHARR